MAARSSARKPHSRDRRPKRGVLATIGYEGRTITDLCAALKDAQIGTLVDVRYRAWSHRPVFRKTALAHALSERGVSYVHLPMAGNVPLFRVTPRPTQTECMRLYARHLASQPEVVARLGELAQDGRIALLCYEADALSCHRSHLCKAIVTRFPGLECVHM